MKVDQNMVLIASLTLITAGCTAIWWPLGPLSLGSLLLAGLVWKGIVERPRKDSE